MSLAVPQVCDIPPLEFQMRKIPSGEGEGANMRGWLIVELRHRSVRIFKPTRNTMQSGGAKGEKWRIDFDILQGSGRWENPQMGWASSYVVLVLFFFDFQESSELR